MRTGITLGALGAAVALAGCAATASPQTGASGSHSASPVPVVTTAPVSAPTPAPNGTYQGSCNYLLGSNPVGGTAEAVGEIDVTNTGNIGTISKEVITWPQEGYAPLREVRKVHVAAGATKRVSFKMPLSYNQISALQAWQTGHGFADGCTYKSYIVSTYGNVGG